MSCSTRLAVRLTAGTAAALIAFGLSAATTSADPLPLPLPSVPVVSDLTNALPPLALPRAPGATSVPALPAPIQSAAKPLTDALGQAADAAKSAAPAAPAAQLPSAPAIPAPVLDPLKSVGTQVKGGVDSFNKAAVGTPLAGKVTSSPGGVLNLAVNAAPLAQACAQAPGSGTAVVNTTVTIGGQKVTAPFVQLLPGVVAACPASALNKPPGSVISVGGAVGNLLGACVRINDTGVPLNASILVLTTELIATLTQNGVPLQQLVVPCPGTSTNPGGTTGGNSGGNAGGTAGNGSRAANSAVPAGLNAVNAGGTLPHTGADMLPWLFYGIVLLAGGSALTFAAKRRLALVPVRKD